jgi:hypothetical protein
MEAPPAATRGSVGPAGPGACLDRGARPTCGLVFNLTMLTFLTTRTAHMPDIAKSVDTKRVSSGWSRITFAP